MSGSIASEGWLLCSENDFLIEISPIAKTSRSRYTKKWSLLDWSLGKTPTKLITDWEQIRKLEDSPPELSIVIPANDEEGNIPVLYQELTSVLEPLELSWEVIFSDDGSGDGTWSEILELHRHDKRVSGIRLSRNFGHQYALFAGLQHARGGAVISMDADLQHPPSVIPELLEKWKAGYKIVGTIRIDPEDFSVFKRVTAQMFYKIFSFLSGVKLERGMADFRLLDRSVVAQLIQFREEGLFLRGLVQWIGYPTTNIRFQSGERFSGTTKYNLRKMIGFAWHGIVSFSIVPLRLGIVVGVVMSLLSFAWLLEALYAKLVLDTAVPGWASAVGYQSLLFGILFILLGLLGEYLGRILVQVRQRPLFIVYDSVGMSESHQMKTTSQRPTEGSCSAPHFKQDSRN